MADGKTDKDCDDDDDDDGDGGNDGVGIGGCVDGTPPRRGTWQADTQCMLHTSRMKCVKVEWKIYRFRTCSTMLAYTYERRRLPHGMARVCMCVVRAC